MARRNEDILDRLINSLSVRGTLLHPGTLFVLVTVLTIAGALHLWERYQHRLIPADDYQLTAERVRMTPAPAWAKIDLKRLLLEVPPGHQPPNILDTDVVGRSAMTLQSVGWVEEVQEVRKSADGLDIQLRYRKPVGMVELNHTNVPGWAETKTAQVMPVDANGMVMPAHVVQHFKLPRISVFHPQNLNAARPWSVWSDARIQDAAGIVELLGPRARQFGVYRVMTMRSSRQLSASQIPFELWPENGTKVIWGNAPGKEAVGEAAAQVKLAALVRFVGQRGSLGQMPDRKVDLRSGKIVITHDSHVAERGEIFAGVK
jgi:hypothetical protein